MCYITHICACIWIYFGKLHDCEGVIEPCNQTWIYANGFDGKPEHTIYIFSFYWIFEVITTVGYGDYSGATTEEFIFSIALEFMGLTFFSFLMGSISDLFDTDNNFEALIEEKLDTLDMWIKKIEKSNKPYHIQPTLYNDIRNYVEQAFQYDFNFIIEEFDFYNQITPKMQTDLIQNTRTFKEFEKSFSHFFEECERGFTNEFIIKMYCRIYQQNRIVVAYKANLKEMYFIKQGMVQVHNNEMDANYPRKPILYLPKFAYFGDYNILHNLKSNLVFKTLSGERPTDELEEKKKLENLDNKDESAIKSRLTEKEKVFDKLPETIFMCINK